MRLTKTYKIDSSSVQGEGSFIELKRITYGERREVIAKIQELEDNDTLFAFYLEKVKEFVLDWNWQDENGVPIPLGEFELLMPEELSFIVSSIGRLLRGELVLDTKN